MMFLLLLLLVGAAAPAPRPPCQQYRYDLPRTGGKPPVIFLGCTSYEEKPGCCPAGCQFSLPGIDFAKVRCEDDRNCPPGYKCCDDPCVLAHKICRASLATWNSVECAV